MTLSFQGQKIVKFLLHSYCLLNKRKLQKLFEKTCQSLDKTHKICRNKDKTFLMKITKMTRNWKSFSLYTSPQPLELTKIKDGLCGREWVAFGVFSVVKYLLIFFANGCIVHFQSNALILFYWQIPNKRNAWLLKREPVSPTLPGWKKGNNTDSQYFTKALEMMLNTTYLAILRSVTFSVVLGAEFTVSTCWVWFYKRATKFEKFPTVSADGVFEYVSFLLSFQGAFRSWKHLYPSFLAKLKGQTYGITYLVRKIHTLYQTDIEPAPKQSNQAALWPFNSVISK